MVRNGTNCYHILLFTYRKVPQASTGFSPFELLYGQQIQGPLDILRETCEGSEGKDESVISYVLLMRERRNKMIELLSKCPERSEAMV